MIMIEIVIQNTCHEVQEGQSLKVFGLVVAELHNLVVPLLQGFYPKPMPSIFVVNFLQDSNTRMSELTVNRKHVEELPNT